jgi:glycosyltransferase involved in cell wall biosynthesis
MTRIDRRRQMKVSVVIPVYNAAAYVEQAVQSVLDQPETAEVLMVEDGCPDPDSLPTCRRLAETDDRVRILRHPNGENRGPSASRNLGIEEATCDYIAFLDADDFYLPGRFEVAEQVFADDPTVDAVYEEIGIQFESPESKRAWDRMGQPDVTAIRSDVPPDRVFEEAAPIGKGGKCCLEALTIRKHILEKAGLFDVSLRRQEDGVFFMNLAAYAKMRPGHFDRLVAIRRVHAENHTTRPETWQMYMATWLSVYRWLKPDAGQKARVSLVLECIRRQSRNRASGCTGRLTRSIRLAGCLGHVLRCEPRLAGESVFLRGLARDIYRALRGR